MGTVHINYQTLGGAEFLGSVERSQVPRIGDEVVMIPQGKKRAFMYRIVRVIWDEQPGAVQHSADKGSEQCVDIYLERV